MTQVRVCILKIRVIRIILEAFNNTSKVLSVWDQNSMEQKMQLRTRLQKIKKKFQFKLTLTLASDKEWKKNIVDIINMFLLK